MRAGRTAMALSGLACLAACSAYDAPAATAKSGLSIEEEDANNFVAEYWPDSGPAIRVVVRYAPETTFFEVTSSNGETLISDGTEPRPMPAVWHTRAGDGPLVIDADDPELDAVVGMKQALVTLGTHSNPSDEERATPRYAAAYWMARLLGELDSSPTPEEAATVWPWPGIRPGLVTPDQQCVFNPALSAKCCGPCECSHGINEDQQTCSPDNVDSVLDWWCAAGDHCNYFRLWRAYPGGNCGTTFTCNDGTQGGIFSTCQPGGGYNQTLSFHHDSSILHFVGCGCAKPGDLCCDWANSSAGPQNYCSAPYQATSAWAVAGQPPTHYCGCPDGGGKDYCGAYANAQDAANGCIHNPSYPLAANTIYACTNANMVGNLGFNAQYTNPRPCQACAQTSTSGPTCTPIPPPACGCYSGNGGYCGSLANNYAASHGCSVPNLANNSLYNCANGAWTLTAVCANGCTFNPSGSDYCTKPASSCGCYSGNGAYCGFKAQQYDSSHSCSMPITMNGDDLYNCSNGTWTLKQDCTNGCTFNTSGPDFCTACPGPVCGSTCCQAGAWCGNGGNKCCTGCDPGCPC